VRSSSLRTHWKIRLTTEFADDYTVLIAWLFAVGQAVMVSLYTVKSWQGYHYYDIPKLSIEDRTQAAKYDLVNQLLYNPILALVKASIVFFLWRLEDRRKVIR
jgi:hypothetical protein